MRRFATISLSLVACLACHVAFAGPQQLRDNEVWATTIDGFSVMIPPYGMGGYHLGQPPNHQEAGHYNDDWTVDMTKEQVCKKLSDSKPANCSENDYSAAAGIPSSSGDTFQGDGCSEGNIGAGSGLNLEMFTDLKNNLGNNFSRDFNAPSKVRPSLNFTTVCNTHDFWYSAHLTQENVDHAFALAANLLCVAGAAQGDCNNAVNAYSKAFAKAGGDAYAARQLKAQCSSWGHAMKTNHCSRSG